MSTMLSMIGLHTESITKSTLVYSTALKYKPDLILLDIEMPEMDGFEVCEKIKGDASTRDIPVIFITARTDKANIVKGFSLGASDYISKPFNHDEFYLRIYHHLELKKTKDTIARQNEALQKKNKDITESINYASQIQMAVLPSKELLKDLLPQHFVFYKPKDIVSGDFYWIKKIKQSKNNFSTAARDGESDVLIMAVADCTGHGVPAALMSMLGISLLNEIIISYTEGNKTIGNGENNSLLASDLLNLLRQKLKYVLQQTGRDNETKDGMDIALCIIDIQKNKMQYAGANMPLYLIRRQITDFQPTDLLSLQDENGNTKIANRLKDRNEPFERWSNGQIELLELKPDKMPVGVFVYEKESFNNFEIQLNKGDSLYFATDGYTDQFGGPVGRKFYTRRFKELLVETTDYDIDQQKVILETAHRDWKGSNEQIDDILVMGVKI